MTVDINTCYFSRF